MISISNPDDVRKILSTYKHAKEWTEDTDVLGPSNTFTTSDAKLNSIRRRQLAPAYTQSHISEMEDLIWEAGPMSIRSADPPPPPPGKMMQSSSSSDGILFNYFKNFNYMACVSTTSSLQFTLRYYLLVYNTL